jgi:hypothetical protein
VSSPTVETTGKKKPKIGMTDLIEAVHEACLFSDELGVDDAGWLSDEVIDMVIAALRVDPTMPQRSYTDWRLHLANLRQRFEDRLEQILNERRLDVDGLGDAIVRELMS